MTKDTNCKLTQDLSDADRLEILGAMTQGLHAIMFGVQSQKDPDYAFEAVNDGGELHEYVHAMIRLLPPREK